MRERIDRFVFSKAGAFVRAGASFSFFRAPPPTASVGWTRPVAFPGSIGRIPVGVCREHLPFGRALGLTGAAGEGENMFPAPAADPWIGEPVVIPRGMEPLGRNLR